MSNISGVIEGIRRIMWQDNGLNGDAQRIEQLGWMLFLKIFCDKDKEMELMDEKYESPIPDELHWENWAGNDEGITGDELVEFVDRKLFPELRNIDFLHHLVPLYKNQDENFYSNCSIFFSTDSDQGKNLPEYQKFQNNCHLSSLIKH